MLNLKVAANIFVRENGKENVDQKWRKTSRSKKKKNRKEKCIMKKRNYLDRFIFMNLLWRCFYYFCYCSFLFLLRFCPLFCSAYKNRNKLSAADVKIKDRQNKERKRRSYLAAGKFCRP